jgi:hypothetical protein
VDHEHDGGEIDERTKALEEAAANLYVEDATAPGLSRFRDLAETNGQAAYTGHIGYVAQSRTGDYPYVEFNVDGGGSYSTPWPGWAYELAKTALLNGKRLSVEVFTPSGSMAGPIGRNITFVFILAT